jgi:hypothetical protein
MHAARLSRVRGWQPLLGGVLLAWCLISAVAALRAAIERAPDPMETLESEFLLFLPDLPARGEIGYLEAYPGSGDENSVRMHYAAQYALTPRVVVGRTGPDFLIVPRGSEQPGGDPRLVHYRRVVSYPNGHRLFRRFP